MYRAASGKLQAKSVPHRLGRLDITRGRSRRFAIPRRRQASAGLDISTRRCAAAASHDSHQGRLEAAGCAAPCARLYGDLITARLQHYWDHLPDRSFSWDVKTFYGLQPSHHFLERSVCPIISSRCRKRFWKMPRRVRSISINISMPLLAQIALELIDHIPQEQLQARPIPNRDRTLHSLRAQPFAAQVQGDVRR